MHPTRTGSGSLVPSRHGWRRTTSPLSPPGTLCTAAVTNCTDRYVLGAKTTQTAPTDTCKRPAQILGVFFVGGGVFWGRAFGPNGPIRRAGPIGGIPRVLITDGPSRYGSIDTSLLYPRLGVSSFFTHSAQMIDLAGLYRSLARSLAVLFSILFLAFVPRVEVDRVGGLAQ